MDGVTEEVLAETPASNGCDGLEEQFPFPNQLDVVDAEEVINEEISVEKPSHPSHSYPEPVLSGCITNTVTAASITPPRLRFIVLKTKYSTL